MRKRKIPHKRKRTLEKKDITDASAIFIASGIDVKNRVINLFDDIDSDTVGVVIKGLQLMILSNKKPITININSFGGGTYDAFGLYDYMRSLPCLIKTVNMGACMSAGLIIFLGGDERAMYENTVFMAHSVSSFAEGKINLDLKSEKEECDRLHEQMCKILASNTTKTKKWWAKTIEFQDIYYRKKEALEMGFVHSIVKKKEDKIKEFLNG